MKRYAPTWELRAVFWHQHEERADLELAGWEPFAVTADEDGATVWLRRRSGPLAEVIDPHHATP